MLYSLIRRGWFTQPLDRRTVKVHRVTLSSTVCAIVFTERLTVYLKSLKIFRTERFVYPTSNLNSLKVRDIIVKERSLARFLPIACYVVRVSKARGIRARVLMTTQADAMSTVGRT